MKDQTEVIILSSSDYKEADAMLRVLSKEFGLRTFIAKGLNKINSKNRMACLTYGTSLFHYDLNEMHDLQILQSAESLHNRYLISEDLEKSSIASLVSELTELLLKNETEHALLDEYYDYLNQVLDLITNSEKPYHLLAYILIQFLNHYGISPMVDACVVCGSTKVNSISIDEGGFVCHDCQPELQTTIYDVEALKDFRIIGKLNPQNIEAYLNYKAPSKVVVNVLVEFLEFHTGHHPKAWDFIEKWSIIK